ncbi:nuclear receptor-binding protein-like isoform X2 [Corticium candelabrum]|uniref:nuclear receptor-binding protein-like isoform X2 n=1 Tax=Corticium candelabrum TaxID=121492 RepID=UPI002E2723FF|nr:nuclear receptor-binding protein-like isoform X2 [Corticium candelabrum]
MPDKNTTTTTTDDQRRDSGEDSEDEVLEEDPDGRWQKRRKKVTQRDVPGIDAAYLAMDTEEGVEVVWNELYFSERKMLTKQENYMRLVFDNLTKLKHPNIVRFYKYWKAGNGQRVVFITEFMTSGSLKSFIKKAQKNKTKVGMKMWKRWCRQILYALSHFHGSNPEIIHGNLTCDTVFIQHNGLIKIGCVAPEMIHKHVKTVQDARKNLYYTAPEYGSSSWGSSIDIYAFGVCALEMAMTEQLTTVVNGAEGKTRLPDHEAILSAVDRLEDSRQREFIRSCVAYKKEDRPTAKELLMHDLLFDVHPLKVFAAHKLVTLFDSKGQHLETTYMSKLRSLSDKEGSTAEIKYTGGREPQLHQSKPSDTEKFLQEVRDGLYPLTGVIPPDRSDSKLNAPAAESLSIAEGESTPEFVENRQVASYLSCKVTKTDDSLAISLCLKLDDKVQRRLSCDLRDDDTAEILVNELVHHGYINKADHDALVEFVTKSLESS